MATPSKPVENTAAEAPSSRRRGGQKRKANNLGSGSFSAPSTTSLKRQAREKPPVVPFPPIHSGPWTRARQHPNSATISVASSSEFVKSEDSAALVPQEGVVGEAVKVEIEVDLEALEAKIEAECEAIRMRDANTHVVPIHAGWFSWTRIHPIEERGLPAFFNGKSENRTPDLYIEIRNCIMKKFHADPNVQLELKDLLELSVGELDMRQEVIEFLDYWGLINYNPFPPTVTVARTADADGMEKKDSLIDMLYSFSAEQSSEILVSKNNVVKPSAPSALFPKPVIPEELTRPESESVEYHCNSCSADCSRKRYHCQKQADFDLCTECFSNGKFGSGMSPSDFILMEPAEAAGVGGGKWTDQETLLLLEALELFKDNWNEIAEHVATKTKAECILHFVQMPIEDTFLDYSDEIDASVEDNGDPVSTNDDNSPPKDASESNEDEGCTNEDQSLFSGMEISKPDGVSESKLNQEANENITVKALREAFEAVGSLPSPEEQFSFAEAGNPVMALVAFLVRLVKPNIVTASVCSSIKSVSGNGSGMLLAARHCFILDDPPDDKKKSDDSDRAYTEMIELEAQKDESHNDEKQKGENFSSVCIKDVTSNDSNNTQNRDTVAEEGRIPVSLKDECINKSQSVEEPNARAVCDEPKHTSQCTETDNPNFPNEQVAKTAEISDDSKSALEPHSRSVRESEDAALVGRFSESRDGPKDDDVKSDSLPLEKKEGESIISNSPSENETNTVEEETKEPKDENKYSIESKVEPNIDSIKRAAITAISAAAVKAKLLAQQEEDQIRQLAVLLMEKQLHKLEAKLAFFTEMESVVMRAREHLERSKQRLYQERAQIIASRFGVPPSASRLMPQSSPMNRAASAFANLAPRLSMSMTSQRPPMSKPIMASVPTSNSILPTTVAGSSVQPPM